MSVHKYIKTASDLVTSHEQVRDGFLKIALEKSVQANPYIKEARALKNIASQASSPGDLMNMADIKAALLTAAGLSDKALNHLTDESQQIAILNLIEKFLEPAGTDFVDELVFRFLLTRGDSLGGKMRNLAGKFAEKQLIRNIIATLSIHASSFRWMDSNSQKWIIGNKDDPNIENYVKGLSWGTDGRERTLIFNLTVPKIRKNVDLCLFSTPPNKIIRGHNKKSAHYDQNNYLALGELKGGIDPAGADEHWKTANSALTRIRDSFAADEQYPALFFIAAAIENSMAGEIFSQLNSDQLAIAANLNNENQIYELCNWLVKL